MQNNVRETERGERMGEREREREIKTKIGTTKTNARNR